MLNKCYLLFYYFCCDLNHFKNQYTTSQTSPPVTVLMFWKAGLWPLLILCPSVWRLGTLVCRHTCYRWSRWHCKMPQLNLWHHTAHCLRLPSLFQCRLESNVLCASNGVVLTPRKVAVIPGELQPEVLNYMWCNIIKHFPKMKPINCSCCSGVNNISRGIIATEILYNNLSSEYTAHLTSIWMKIKETKLTFHQGSALCCYTK